LEHLPTNYLVYDRNLLLELGRFQKRSKELGAWWALHQGKLSPYDDIFD
jgi:hypothetical protein